MDGVSFGGNSDPNANNGLNAHSGDITIGQSDGIRFPDESTSSGNYYNGYIDEFKLWNRSLTGAELLNERWNVNDGTKSGTDLIVYYNFNNDAVPTITDETGGNDGTLYYGVTHDHENPFIPTISWSPGGMTSFSVDVTPTASTTYTYTLTHPYYNCETIHSIDVAVNSPDIPGLNSNSPVCEGDDAIFTVTGNAGDVVTYSGSTSGNVTIGAGGSANITLSAISADVTLNLTNVNDGSCDLPLTGISETVTVNPLPLTGEIIPD